MNRILAALVALLALFLVLGGAPARSPHPAAADAALTLTPDSGPPGTVVTVSGQVPAPAEAAAMGSGDASQHADVCWDGCPGGLTYEAVAVQWAAEVPGAFTLQFTVPAVPWLEANGAHVAAPGDYAVGVQCLTPPGGEIAGGCAVMPAPLTATFHVTGTAPASCGLDACATLALSPSEAAPGALVQAQGSAPLVDVIGDRTCCYDLALLLADPTAAPVRLGSIDQTSDGAFTGSFRVPLSLPGLGLLQPGAHTLVLQASRAGASPQTPPAGSLTIAPLGGTGSGSVRITLAPTSFTVDAAPSWDTFASSPLNVQRSTSLLAQPASGDAATAGRVAACVPGAILLSEDDGATWSSISTAGAAQIAAGSPFPFLGSGAAAEPSCVSVLLDPAHPQSLYATFTAGKAPYGAPPLVYVPYATADGGQTWQPVAPPDGYTADQFGGFQLASDGSVQALFGGSSASPSGQPPALAVEATSDGGGTWSSSQLTCPDQGPCVRWGSGPNVTGSCAMHGYPQAIFYSLDGGATWQPSTWPSGANACDENELAALSPSSLVLLSGRDDYPLRLSQDGGASWQALALPSLPDQPDEPQRFQDLQILPDGSLLAHGAQAWYLLPPSATAWCRVAALPADAQQVDLAGDRLWWQTPYTSGALPQSVALADVTCATGG